MRYSQHYNTKRTPQSESIPFKKQVQNSAGGFVFAVTPWTRLDRFLILGNEGGTYYASEKKLTKENATCVQECLDLDPKQTVDRIVEISQSGRAPKNDPAIFALSIAASYNERCKSFAYSALNSVCRTGTDLFSFVESVKGLRGWGRGLRTAVSNWYMRKEPSSLAYQAIKYQQRNGWSHKDVLRLSHPKVPKDSSLDTIFNWITKGWESVGELPHDNKDLVQLWAFEKVKKSTSVSEVCKLITEYNLPRECVPTNFLTEPEVWNSLLVKMPMTAMIRNLATMTKIGLLAPFSDASKVVQDRLGDSEYLRKARVHPIKVLAALRTYSQGHGDKGHSAWIPVSQVIEALDSAFYKTFDFVEPTNKRFYLGCDVSGSMWSGKVGGINLTPGEATGALSMVTVATEPSCYTAAFHTSMIPFTLHKRQSLQDVSRIMQGLDWGGTDCGLPMLDALQKKIPVDCFVIFTDNETWAGHVHPCQALNDYRQKMGIPAKLVVAALTSTGFSICDPQDGGSMDCVGFDTSLPTVISDFVKS